MSKFNYCVVLAFLVLLSVGEMATKVQAKECWLDSNIECSDDLQCGNLCTNMIRGGWIGISCKQVAPHSFKTCQCKVPDERCVPQ
ncbi:hypothetical protein ACHQM5_008988 [Ranunculus cassubicifolius]